MFRSPLRGPWLTTALGSVLLVLIAIVAATGFLSHVAYLPDLKGNAIVANDLPFNFAWPARPTYLYAITQGLHTNVGLVAIPFLLAKLWSVIPKLFEFPPVRSPAHAIERLSIALLVSSSIFELATGVVNAQYWYAFKFNFVVAHYYGAVVFVSSLALHVIVKLPAMRGAYATRKEVVEVATMSRRGLFAFAGARRAHPARGQRRPDARRPATQTRLPRTPARGLPGQPARRDRRGHARDDRAELPAVPHRGREDHDPLARAARRAPNSAPRRSRSPASRAGRPRRPGPASRSRRSPASREHPRRSRSSSSRSSARARSATRASGEPRSPRPTPCSRSRSTATTSRSTTATRRGSSSPRSRACTTRSGWRG